MRNVNMHFLFVRNSDGTNLDSDSYGDLQYQYGPLRVSDGRLGAKFTSLKLQLADGTVVQDPWKTALRVGTRIRFVAEGTDPKGLPLEFKFMLGRHNSFDGTIPKQDWSPSNIFEHVLVDADVTTGTGLHAYVRNNDGWNHNSNREGDDWVR